MHQNPKQGALSNEAKDFFIRNKGLKNSTFLNSDVPGQNICL